MKITFNLTDGTTITVGEHDVDYNKPMEGFVSIWIQGENVIRVLPSSQIEQIEIKPERILKVIEQEAA